MLIQQMKVIQLLWQDHRQAAMETAITNASDTPALETLYTYTKDSDGVVSRPLPEIPTLD